MKSQKGKIMEFEILKHSIINFIGNLAMFFLFSAMIVWIISSCFGINNSLLPFGWITKFFRGLVKILIPVFKWLLEKLKLLLKIIFKLVVFALERFFVLLVDIFRKLFSLIQDPDD